jgi:septum formation protein
VVNVSRVTFARIPRAELEAYVATGEPMDKAGAYGIQGAIARHVRRIEGSYSSIMGLPLYETARLLGHAGRAAS